MRLTDAFEAAESHEVAVLRMARVNCNLLSRTKFFTAEWKAYRKMSHKEVLHDF